MRPPPAARLEQYCMMSLLHIFARPCNPRARFEILPDARYVVRRHLGLILSSYEMRHATRRSFPGDTLEQKVLRSLAQSTAKAACALAVCDPAPTASIVANDNNPINHFCIQLLPRKPRTLALLTTTCGTRTLKLGALTYKTSPLRWSGTYKSHILSDASELSVTVAQIAYRDDLVGDR